MSAKRQVLAMQTFIWDTMFCPCAKRGQGTIEQKESLYFSISFFENRTGRPNLSLQQLIRDFFNVILFYSSYILLSRLHIMPNTSDKLLATSIKDQTDPEFIEVFIEICYKWRKNDVFNKIKPFSNTALICLYLSSVRATFLENLKLTLYQKMQCYWKL